MIMPKKGKSQILVYVYGFDQIGYQLGDTILTETEDLIIKSIAFNSDEKLDKADGLIIPHGIFEKITYRSTVLGPQGNVTHDRELILEREREVLNLLKDEKWVCFFVREIVDVIQVEIRRVRVNDTDLCKRILNRIGVRRYSIDGLTSTSLVNEFQTYIREFGVAKTLFEFPNERLDDFSALAKAGDGCAGFEFGNQLFFLPFHTTKFDEQTCISLVSVTTHSILEYRRKRLALIPKWMDDFNFQTEAEIKLNIDKLKKQMLGLEKKLLPYQNYKLIVSISGEILKEKVVGILENYFGFKIDPIDKGREDAKILDDNNKIIAMIEIKGTNKGIKREHINQVDSHRERNDLFSELPGILIINNEMNLEGLEERLKTTVPAEHIKHAVSNNVLIIRTIDFLYFMKHLEVEDECNRKKKFLEVIESGGGWLSADPEGYKVVLE